MIEIEYELREKDLIAFNEHQLNQNQKLQKLLQRHQVLIPSVFGMIATAVLFFLKDIPAGALMAVIAISWGVGAPYYLKWSWRKQIRKMYTEEEKASALRRYTLRLLPKELVEVTPDGNSGTPWRDVLRIEFTKKYAFLFVSLDAALIIPRDTVSKGDLHEFVKLADQYISEAEN